jgi:hypothetical protein
MTKPASLIPLEDRLPTFGEVDGFDDTAAWDRLTPTEQRRVGILAVRLGTAGQRLTFDHGDWTPQQVRLIEHREADLLTEFFNAIEPLWARLFGWTSKDGQP